MAAARHLREERGARITDPSRTSFVSRPGVRVAVSRPRLSPVALVLQEPLFRQKASQGRTPVSQPEMLYYSKGVIHRSKSKENHMRREIAEFRNEPLTDFKQDES